MDKVAIVGFGEIGQSISQLYDLRKYEVLAVDPALYNIINNIYKYNSNHRTELLKGLKKVILNKTLTGYTDLSRVRNRAVTEPSDGTEPSVTSSKTSDSKSYKDLSHNIEYHNNINILNICFGHSESFIEFAVEYVKFFNPELVIVHSTVPIGTCRAIGEATGVKIAHSPVIGKHPDLTESLTTFEKAVSGIDAETVEMACSHLNELNVDCVPTDKLENTELAKMLSTSYYAHCIDWMRDVKQLCDEQHVDFAFVYNKFNNIYNNGYEKMDMSQFKRPVLKYMEGTFGGHCVGSNLKILGEIFPAAKSLLKKDIEFSSRKNAIKTLP